jgi:hypothetical protein
LAQAIRLGESNDTLLARPQSIKKWIGVEMRYSRIRAVGRRARRCTAANDSGDDSELEEKIKSLTLHSVVTPKRGSGRSMWKRKWWVGEKRWLVWGKRRRDLEEQEDWGLEGLLGLTPDI